MNEIAIRDLRSHCERVLERVARGETLTVTRAGRPVAELRPLPALPLSAEVLLSRWRALPPVHATKLKRDIDSVLDPSL